MKFELTKAIEILERTPSVLTELLSGLSDDWIYSNEGENTWSAFDVIGHLIHGERTDWVVRMNIILEHGTSKTFEPFDRFAQFQESRGKSLMLLLEEFTRLRQENLRFLKSKRLDEMFLNLKGMHPDFGEVTLRQLLATWVAHDLGHLVQICRVMAKLYREEAGPWKNYLSVLQ